MDLAKAFAVAVGRQPQRLAVVEGGIRRTYAEWFADAQRVAGGLAALGLRRGDPVLLALKNRYELTTLYWACHMAGLIYTPLNWRATAADVAYCLDDAEARAIVFERASEEAALEAVSRAQRSGIVTVAVADAAQGDTTYARLADAQPMRTVPQYDERDICIMLYTSGTSGRPKGVPRSHASERSAAVAQVAHHQYAFGEISLGAMPLYHTMGVRILLSTTLLSGTLVCMPTYDTERALELIQQERVSALFLVPTLYHDLLHHPKFAAYDRSSLARLGYAGMAMSDALSEACLKAFRPQRWVNHYGSSEIYTFSICDHLDIKPGCAGRAGLNQELRIVRPDPGMAATPRDLVPAGEAGEVIASLASPEAFRGYWKRPDADARAIRDGWYFTGDLGRMDEEGELYLLGRVDDMVISAGENIHPDEVENVLARCPLVARVAVAGVADERLGAKVVAFVEPVSAEASAEKLEQYCLASPLARYKRPRGYVFVERIPQSPVGKILRRELRAGHYKRLPGFRHTA